MPIKQYIKLEMGSAGIDRLNIACATARTLDLIDRDDPLTAFVAEKVVEIGRSVVADPREIADAVVRHFRNQQQRQKAPEASIAIDEGVERQTTSTRKRTPASHVRKQKIAPGARAGP
jgi:hypothetical protein